MSIPDYLSVAKTRPTSITIIAWFLIVTNTIGVFGCVMALNNPQAQAIMAQSPLPIPVQYALGIAGMVIVFACAVGMLKAQAWSRIVYVAWNLIGTAIGLATSPFKLMILPGFVLFLVICFFLFRPAANSFFAESGAATDGQIG